MTAVESLVLTLIAAALAVVVERLAAHFSCRTAEDYDRLDAAAKSIVAQRQAVDDLFARDSVPDILREFIIDSGFASMTRTGAHILVDIISGRRPVTISDASAKKYADCTEALKDLMVKDPDAYDIYRTYIFRLPVTTILQWPETFRAIANLSLRLASEKEPAATRDVAAMRSEISLGNLAHT